MGKDGPACEMWGKCEQFWVCVRCEKYVRKLWEIWKCCDMWEISEKMWESKIIKRELWKIA